MAPTRLPSPVRIGPYTWTFSADKKEWDKEPDKDKSDGICDGELLRIILNPEVLKRHPLHVKQIVTHELTHACFTSAHRALDMRNEDDAEESFVEAFSPLLLGMLRDNPHLVEWLTS